MDSVQSQDIPLNDPSIQQIAAGYAGLTLKEYQEQLDGDRNGVNSMLHFDESRAPDENDVTEYLQKIFKLTQVDREHEVSSQTQIVVSPPASQTSAPLLPLASSRHDLVSGKDLLKQHYTQSIPDLCRAVFREEIEAKLVDKKGLAPKDLDWTAIEMQDVLYSTPRTLLESIIFGNLARDKLANQDLRTILEKISRQSAKQPSIYFQQLVDNKGNSPTPTELLRALELMEGYIKGCNRPETSNITSNQLSDDDVYAIDSWRGYTKQKLDAQHTKNGFRKYMSKSLQGTTAVAASGGKGKGKAVTAPVTQTLSFNLYSAAHVNQTLAFIAALRNRIKTLESNDPKKLDVPLDFPLCEVGYSNRSLTRLEHHKAHHSSNYIMNLMEAIFQRMPKEFKGVYEIEQHVIYLIWEPSQAEVSEIGWTKLAEGYIHNGGGFSHYPAGLSNESAQKTPEGEWNEAREYMFKHSPFRDNMEQIRQQQNTLTADDAITNLETYLENWRAAYRNVSTVIEEFAKRESEQTAQEVEMHEKVKRFDNRMQEFGPRGLKIIDEHRKIFESIQEPGKSIAPMMEFELLATNAAERCLTALEVSSHEMQHLRSDDKEAREQRSNDDDEFETLRTELHDISSPLVSPEEENLEDIELGSDSEDDLPQIR